MSTTPPTPLFTSRRPARTGLPLAAGLVALLLFVAVIAFTRKPESHPKLPASLAPDPYAANLSFDRIAMSESTSLSGGKCTFIDGHVRNAGSGTVSAATVQTLFHNDVQLPPQAETQPLMLIRTHEPYVDTQYLSASPLHPGEDREFRLTFESIASNWNGQIPEIRITHIALQ